MTHEYPPRASFLPGRWQPLHDGHKELVWALLAECRQVVIGIFDTPLSKRNPWTFEERVQMFLDAFPDQFCNGTLSIVRLPWVQEIVYGRDCGWTARHIELDAQIEQITATNIRQEMQT